MKNIIVLITALCIIMLGGCGSDKDLITPERAKAIAMSHAAVDTDSVTFVKAELEIEDDKRVYEVEFYGKDNTEYDYIIDATTGDVISFDADAEMFTPPASSTSAPATAIDEAKAKELALKKVPGASEADIHEFKTDIDDGRKVYEGKIIYNKTEYEFEIDSETGKFYTWEQESILD